MKFAIQASLQFFTFVAPNILEDGAFSPGRVGDRPGAERGGEGGTRNRDEEEEGRREARKVRQGGENDVRGATASQLHGHLRSDVEGMMMRMFSLSFLPLPASFRLYPLQHSVLGPRNGNERRGLHRRRGHHEHDGDASKEVLLHVSLSFFWCLAYSHGLQLDCLTLCAFALPFFSCLCRTSKHLSLQQMPDLTEEHIKAASDAKLQVSRFTGNPSKLLGPDADAEEDEPEEETPEGEEGAEPAEDAPPKKPRRVKFSEAHRLHFTCRRIDSECGVVPRGAFAVTPTHHVVVNRSFVGISATDANNIGSYCHFRPATGAARKGALARAAVVGAGDFLDPLSEDEPKGTWSSVLALGRGSVQLRNARWPGYFFWHAFETPKFGSVYQGDGRRNEDLSWSI